MLTNVINHSNNDNIFYLTNESFNNKSLFIFISQKVMCSPYKPYLVVATKYFD